MLWYHGIVAFSHCHRAAMRLTQPNNLAILTAVLLNRRALAISELARAATSELPASHHQHKQRIWRFLSNDNFAPISAKCALIPAICHLAGIKGLAPVMIDWSELGRKRNGLFDAVCFRCYWQLEVSDRAVCCTFYSRCPAHGA